MPGPVLTNALDFVDAQLGQMVSRIHNQGLDRSTTIILSAKHGQSPTDPNALTRINDGAILDALNAAWAAGHPGVAALVTFSIDDDGMLLWLSDRSAAATAFAKQWLLSHPATGKHDHRSRAHAQRIRAGQRVCGSRRRPVLRCLGE